MLANIVADLLERARIDKRRDAIGPYFMAFACQRGCDRYHILFGNAGIDEAFAQNLLQRLQCHKPQIAGQEHHVGIAGTCHHRIAKPHFSYETQLFISRHKLFFA